MNTPGFHSAIDELAPRVLHGKADDMERSELGRLLAQSKENRRRFLDHTALHSLLAHEAKAGSFADNKVEYFRQMETSPAGKPSHLLKIWLAAAAVLIAACLVVIPLLPVTATAALNCVIAEMGKTLDRTYRIEVIESGGTASFASHGDRGRFPIAAHLDGATLWLRGRDQFVLRQSLPNGETRILGSDGVESWSIRGKDAVRIDRNLDRFGGGLGTKRREIAFLDPGLQIEELKRLYEVEWLDRPVTGPWKLRGLRRSADQGGAKEIELWFDHGSGILERMILRRLPREQGGPESVSIQLTSTETLASDFFKHGHHHESDRPVVNESSKSQ